MMQSFGSISITFVCWFGYICMAEKFCKIFLEISRIHEKLFVIFAFCAGIITEAVCRCYLLPNIVLSLVNHIIFMGLVIFLFKGNTGKKILAASVLITVTTLVENFCVAFFSCLLLFWRHTVKNIPVPVLGDMEGNLILSFGIIITIWVIYRGSEYFASVFDCRTGKWYIICAIPLLAITAVIGVANWGASNGILMRSGGNMGLYYDQIFSYAGFCVLTALSMFGAGAFVFGMNKIYLEQEKSNRYHLQITTYKMLEEQYSRLERLRHDLKNHIIALSGLLENKELEKMKEYLKNIEDGAGLGIGEEITGNRTVDILLYQKRSIAKEKNITWECDARIPRTCCINAFDLCVLFGNILDNALEACERLQKNAPHCSRGQFINIRAGIVKRCFLLEVKNSADTTDTIKNVKSESDKSEKDKHEKDKHEKDKHEKDKHEKDKSEKNKSEKDKSKNDKQKNGMSKNAKSETGFSDKANRYMHGIGLLNVRDVVHRYDGVMNIETGNGIFVISILVPLVSCPIDN